MSKYLVPVLLMALFLAVEPAQYYNSSTIEYHEVGAWMHPKKDSCISTELNNYEVKVVIGDIDKDGVMGRWGDKQNTIELENTSVDTIAHEVNHMVESAYIRFRMEDPHLKAYMQGFYTQCVYDIVERSKTKPNIIIDVYPNA